jgi:hypothetical protein
MNDTIIKRLSQGWCRRPITELPTAGSKLKFSGEEMPMGTIKHVEERTGTVIFKIPGHTAWAGKGLPRDYVPAETVVLKHVEDSQFEVLAVY